MKEYIKKSGIVIVVLIVGYVVVFKTPLIYNKTDTYSKWVARFARVETGHDDRDDPGLVFYDDQDAMRDDYVRIIDSDLRELMRQLDKMARIDPPRDFRMAWRDGRDLYITNPTAYAPALYVSKSWEGIAPKWEAGLKNLRDDAKAPLTEKAFFTFAVFYFDRLIVINTHPEERDKTTDTIISLSYGDDRDKIKRTIK